MKKYSIPIDNSIGMALLPRGTVLTVIWRAARERIERAAALAGGKTPAGVAGGVQGAQGNPQPDADTAVPVESPAPTAAQRLRSAEQFANAGNAFGAISEMREAIKLEPNNALYRAAIGLLFVTQRRWSEAEPELREAIRLEPTNAAWHRALAGVLYDQRKLAEAEVEAREAVRLDPNNLSYRTALGDTLFQQQKYAEAETEIREALRLNPNEPVAKELLKKVVKAQKPQKK
jgi:Flp pilus assembly protein TadD